MPYREAVGRFFFLSWNAGGRARLLPEVLKEKGYHFFAIQEARTEQMLQLEDTHNCVLEEKQCIAARKPHRVECRAHGSTRKISWLVAE